jgi:hypothetical protein
MEDKPPRAWGILLAESRGEGGETVFRQPLPLLNLTQALAGMGLLWLACRPLISPVNGSRDLLTLFIEIPVMGRVSLAFVGMAGGYLLIWALAHLWTRRRLVVDAARKQVAWNVRSPFRRTAVELAFDRIELITLDEHAERAAGDTQSPLEIPDSSSGHVWILMKDAPPLNLGKAGYWTSLALARRLQELLGSSLRLRREYMVHYHSSSSNTGG